MHLQLSDPIKMKYKNSVGKAFIYNIERYVKPGLLEQLFPFRHWHLDIYCLFKPQSVLSFNVIWLYCFKNHQINTWSSIAFLKSFPFLFLLNLKILKIFLSAKLSKRKIHKTLHTVPINIHIYINMLWINTLLAISF